MRLQTMALAFVFVACAGVTTFAEEPRGNSISGRLPKLVP